MDVQHNPNRRRFFLEVAGGTAELGYRPIDAHTIELVHTEVPEAAAGQGIGGSWPGPPSPGPAGTGRSWW